MILHDVEMIVWHSLYYREMQNNNEHEIVKYWLTEEYL